MEYPSGGREEQPTPKARGGNERSYPAPEVRARGGGREEQPTPEARGHDERSYPAFEVRGGGREEIPHAPKPEVKGGGGEEQLHNRDQGRWPGGPTPLPRSRGCAGAGGP